MVKIFLICLTFFHLVTIVQSQNLVPNWSFETYTRCPDDFNRVVYAQGWYNPTPSAPEYYNTCATTPAVGVPQNAFGNEQPKTGNAYISVVTWDPSTQNIRDYLQTQLSLPLLAGRKYYIAFYVSLPDRMAYACNNIGAYLSSNAIGKNYPPDTLSVNPQVKNPLRRLLTNKNGWTLIGDTIVAVGGERFITIGNFLSNPQSDTMSVGSGNLTTEINYYIDDVQALPIQTDCSARIIPDSFRDMATLQTCTALNNATLIIYNCFGQTVRIINNISGQTYVLYRNNLPAGTYFVRVINDNKNLETIKIVIIN